MTVTTAHSAPAIDRETPIRLGTAAELGFPDGSMTVSGLRKERAAGRLETWMIAGKEYTSLGAIDEMVKQCRAHKRVPASGASLNGETRPAGSTIRQSGSSEMEDGKLALAALLMRCQTPKQRPAAIPSKTTIREPH